LEKLETSNSYKPPHVRIAHASAIVRNDQTLYYGRSIGNGPLCYRWFMIFRYKKSRRS